jgi:hypothetical protein
MLKKLQQDSFFLQLVQNWQMLYKNIYHEQIFYCFGVAAVVNCSCQR